MAGEEDLQVDDQKITFLDRLTGWFDSERGS
jgi:hypothetical protein